MIPEIAYGSVLAATIAGIISLLGLIISKENKTSEFRQAWIDSLREEISLFIAHINAMHAAGTLDSNDAKDIWEIARDDYVAANTAAARIRLRLNPEEKEAKAILKKITEIEEEFTPPNTPSAGQINSLEKELVNEAKILLKTEWLRVRDGERVYRLARIIALGVLIVGTALIMLFFIQQWHGT